MLTGVRASKSGGRAAAVQASGDGFRVDGQPYVYGARALDLAPGVRVFPLIPLLPSLEAWKDWVAEHPGGALPAPLDCMLGACVWLGVQNLQPASLPLETWTSLVQTLSQRQLPANSARLLGLLRNKEAAKTKKVSVAKPAKKRAPPKARKARAAVEESDDEEYLEDSESASTRSSAEESEESFVSEGFSSSSESEAPSSQSEASTEEEELTPRVKCKVRIVPNLD